MPINIYIKGNWRTHFKLRVKKLRLEAIRDKRNLSIYNTLLPVYLHKTIWLDENHLGDTLLYHPSWTGTCKLQHQIYTAVVISTIQDKQKAKRSTSHTAHLNRVSKMKIFIKLMIFEFSFVGQRNHNYQQICCNI